MTRKRLVNLPNALTLSRIVVLPLLAILIVKDERWLATLVLAFAGFSDILDGWYARHYRQESALGKLMDPVADKILLCVVVVFLVARGNERMSPTLGTLLLAREFLITGLRAFAASAGLVFGAGRMGKTKAFFQMIGMGSLIVGNTWKPIESLGIIPGYEMGLVLLWISVGLSYWSMVRYMIMVGKELRTKIE